MFYNRNYLSNYVYFAITIKVYLEMEKFIAGVRAEPCLWNPSHPEYREVVLRDAAWHRIVIQCNNDSIPNVKSARATWRKLRDNHREALKRAKLGQNKLLPAQITTWKYAKLMQFLEPHMKYRITETIEQDASDEHETRTPDHDVSTSHSADPPECNSPPRKRRWVEQTGEATLKTQDDGDALDSFFNFMLKTTRNMPMWIQTQVKKKIFAVVIEAEEQLSTNEQRDNNATEDYSTSVDIKTELFTVDSSDYS